MKKRLQKKKEPVIEKKKDVKERREWWESIQDGDLLFYFLGAFKGE